MNITNDLLSPRENLLLGHLAARFGSTETDIVIELIRYVLMLTNRGGAEDATSMRHFLDLKLVVRDIDLQAVQDACRRADNSLTLQRVSLTQLQTLIGTLASIAQAIPQG